MSSILTQLLHVEPTLVGIIGGTVCHLILWHLLLDWKFGLSGWLLRKTSNLSLYKEGVCANYDGDPLTEMFGFTKQPGYVWIWAIGAMVHHAFGGGLMIAGWYLGSPTLWKHGMLTEVGGMDSGDLFFRLPWCAFFPPGPFPMSNLVASKAPYLYLQVFHHTVGLTCGLCCIVYFADVPEFQYFGAFIMGGVVLSMVPQLIIACYPPDYYYLHLADKLNTFGVFVYQRIIRHFPIAYTLCGVVYAAEVPVFVKGCFFYSAFAMSFFNLACAAATGEAAVLAIKGKHTAGGGNAAAHITRGAARAHLAFFVAAKSHAWAMRAKKSIAEHKDD